MTTLRAPAGSLGLALGLALAAGNASASEVLLQVERTNGASSCPDAAGFVERINVALGREVAGTSPAETTLHLRLSHDRAGYAAVLQVSGARLGERELNDAGATCDGLSEAIVVAVTLILDEPEPPPIVVVAPPPARVTPPPPLVLPEVPRPPQPRVGLDIYVLQTVGVLGASSFGFAGSASGRLSESLTIGGGIVAVLDEVGVLASSFARVQMNLIATYPELCFTFSVADQSFRGALCGQIYGGFIAAQGGALDSNVAVEPFLAMGNGMIAEGPIVGPLSFTGRVSLIVPVYHAKFQIARAGNVTDLFEASPVGVGMGFGLRAYVP